jgi:hypothetical protein
VNWLWAELLLFMIGSYNLGEGLTECVSTPYGNFTPTAGHHEYYPCPNNTYYYIEGSGECIRISDPPTSFPTKIVVHKKPQYVWLIVGICGVFSLCVACVGGKMCIQRCWRDSDDEHHEHHHRHDTDWGIESDTTIQVEATHSSRPITI